MPDDADQLQLFTEFATCEGTADWTHKPTAMIKAPDGRLYCPRCAVRQTLEPAARRGKGGRK